jgi:hypothetical protein
LVRVAIRKVVDRRRPTCAVRTARRRRTIIRGTCAPLRRRISGRRRAETSISRPAADAVAKTVPTNVTFVTHLVNNVIHVVNLITCHVCAGQPIRPSLTHLLFSFDGVACQIPAMVGNLNKTQLDAILCLNLSKTTTIWSSKLNDHQTRGLLDSGSCRTIVKESLARKLNIEFRPAAAGDRKFLYAAQGARLHVAGYCTVEFIIGGLIFDYEVCCVSNIEQNLILGIDIMRDNGIVCDYTNAVATIHGSLLQLPIYNTNKRNFFVRTTKTTVIPPLTECLVDVKVSDQFRNQTCMLMPVRLRQFKDYAVAHSVNRTRGTHSVCSILNYQETPIVLQKK